MFRRPIQSIAELYDLQTSPEHRELMTYACEDSGERAGSSFLIPRSRDDLVQRRQSMKVWADATFGMVGRSPDYLNTVLMTFAEGADFFGQRGAMFADNVRNYYTLLPRPRPVPHPRASSIRRPTARRARTSRTTPSRISAWSRKPRTA